MKNVLDFLSDNWPIIGPAISVILLRIIPTKKNYCIIEAFMKVLNTVVPNNRKKIIPVILFMLISTLGMSQQIGTFKYIYLTNVTDSTTVVPVNAALFYNQQTHLLKAYENSVWKNLLFRNTAASTELMRSNGSYATPSGLFIPSLGSLSLGNNSLSGSSRNISTLGSASNITLNLISKGVGTVSLSGALTVIASSDASVMLRMGNSHGNIYFGADATTGSYINDPLGTTNINFGGRTGSGFVGKFSDVNLTGNNNPGVTGTGTGGDVKITSGTGPTADGNITIDALTGTAQLSSSGPVLVKTNDQTNATDISITAGSGDIGGNISITAGSGTTAGGNININTNTTDGFLNLQAFSANITSIGSDINLNSQSGGSVILLPQGGGHVILNNMTILNANANLNFPSTAAGASSDLTITITGAVQGSPCFVGTGTLLANGVYTCNITSSNTATVRFTNTNLVSALDPANQTFKICNFSF